MKNRTKNIVRGIKKNLNRFLSILFIVAIGSGFMAGLAATSPDMYETADKYIEECKLYDIDVSLPLGGDEEDISEIESTGVTEVVKGLYKKDMLLESEDKEYTARVMALFGDDGQTDICKTKLDSGRYPEKPGECVIESYMGKYSRDTLGIGDVLYISSDNSEYEDICEIAETDELEIVGIVASPMRLGIESDATTAGSGTIGVNVYTLKEQFNNDRYTDIFVRFNYENELNSFSDEYKDKRDEYIEIIRKKLDISTEDRRKELNKEIDDGIAEISKAIEMLELTNFSNKQPEIDAEVQKSIEELVRKKSELCELSEKIADVSYTLRTRNDLACIKSYDDNVGKVGALSKVFPVFFFLVALLVALTTMTRLVEENRIQIGTLKALGFSNGQILSEYMLFSMLSSVLGCVLGFLIGFRLFPFAINSAYSMLYFLPPIDTPVRWDIVLMVAPVTIGSIFIATLFSCWNEFRACPAVLMVPKAPAAGKRIILERIGFVWKRLPFSMKVTCRNIFRYKKRFFMTIIGVAGCSALLLTGFGIRDSVSDIVARQYDDIDKYELTLIVEDAKEAEKNSNVLGFLEDEAYIEDYANAHSESGKLTKNSNTENVGIMVLENSEDYGKFISLHNRKTREELCPDKGVIITEKLSEKLGVAVGDSIELEFSEGRIAETTIEGISENYISAYVYMTKEMYTELSREMPEYGMIFCLLTEEGIADENITTHAMVNDLILNARTSLSLRKSFSDSLNSINGVIWVLIISAGILCAIVLYNLINVNICERRKELATIRVLGFHVRETEKYIFRETNILSFIGALAGLVLGVWLHGFVIRTVEVEKVMFGRDIYLPSFVLAIAITMLFTIIVNRFMGIQIKRVDMAQAMKAND